VPGCPTTDTGFLPVGCAGVILLLLRELSLELLLMLALVSLRVTLLELQGWIA
jgi:hypothetical protein